MFTAKLDLFKQIGISWNDVIINDVNGLSTGVTLSDKSLWEYYQGVSKTIPQDDNWMNLGVWAFYQALAELAKADYCKEDNLLSTDKVTFELFDRMMSANLVDESWSDERAIWNVLPVRLH